MMEATYTVNVGDGETVEMSGNPDKLDRITQAMKNYGPGGSNKSLQVDTTVLCQGIINARTKNDISAKYAEAIFEAVKRIAYAGPARRMVCDYDRLMRCLAGIEAEWTEVAFLWEHYLGSSLGSGIAVAVFKKFEENDNA